VCSSDLHIVDLMVVVLKVVVYVQNIPKVHTTVNFANAAYCITIKNNF